MPLLIFILIVGGIIYWWYRSNRTLSVNERLYLKRRGYENEGTEAQRADPNAASDRHLLSLLDSLADLSPFSRQRAADEIGEMCSRGRADARMFSSLVTALDDKDASVRASVARALGNLGDKRAVAALQRRLALEESIQAKARIQNAIEKLGQITT